MSAAPPQRSPLDGPAARIAAALVILLCAGALAYLHRETLFPAAKPAADTSNPQLAACLAERIGAVDKMQSEGILKQDQYAAFRARAEAFCQQQFGDGAGAPPAAPPGLPR